MHQLPRPLALPAFSEALLNGIQQYRVTLSSRTISRCSHCAALSEALPRAAPIGNNSLWDMIWLLH